MPPKPHEKPAHSSASAPPKPQPPKHGPHKPPHSPHGKFHYSTSKAVAIGLVLAFIVSAVAGYAMLSFGISVNVILPVLAPIWVGVLTLSYTILKS